ncbi:hepatitis A virus cellular receptor 1 homolog isoform X2 [Toxotes jaculatrix]|uniref:hepatitis A virus cellular receptor 1 homolog isoform X2 n=1 Tax=Toxotes jaculatrix TaxID=941984 RepID=UPI001B3AC99C|nr:hepatitis A virus cellular receptor 1 homolog isoform X2 [Toxotes jaculatrix]
MKLVLLLALLTVAESDSRPVVGRTGENITLHVKYDRKKHGLLSFCWNRGDIPASGCNNQIIATDGHSVTGASSKYQLLGRLDEGDASLTILNLTDTDAGRYGCRVEIPGPFNDEKHHFDLTIDRAPQTTTSAPVHRDTSTPLTAAGPTTGQLTTGSSLTSSSSSSNGFISTEESSSVTVLVCVVFGLVVLVTVGGVIIFVRKWSRLNKLPQQPVTSSVLFSSTLSTLQLQSRGSAVDNIYQIDGGGDGGEYELCP